MRVLPEINIPDVSPSVTAAIYITPWGISHMTFFRVWMKDGFNFAITPDQWTTICNMTNAYQTMTPNLDYSAYGTVWYEQGQANSVYIFGRDIWYLMKHFQYPDTFVARTPLTLISQRPDAWESLKTQIEYGLP